MPLYGVNSKMEQELVVDDAEQYDRSTGTCKWKNLQGNGDRTKNRPPPFLGRLLSRVCRPVSRPHHCLSFQEEEMPSFFPLLLSVTSVDRCGGFLSRLPCHKQQSWRVRAAPVIRIAIRGGSEINSGIGNRRGGSAHALLYSYYLSRSCIYSRLLEFSVSDAL